MTSKTTWGRAKSAPMLAQQVCEYFEARLKKGTPLKAGSNFMVDADATVWRCMVWAAGGIWHIMSYDKQHPDYREMYKEATARKDTQFKKGKL